MPTLTARFNRSNTLLPSLAIMLTSGAAALAAGFWLSKPYAQWTEKEAQKILTSSPWAQIVNVKLTTQDAAGGEQEEADDDESAGGPARQGGSKSTLLVVWSGKTIRSAQLRQRQLQGQPADEAKDKAYISGPDPDSYVLVVQGPGFVALGKSNEADLKASSKLVLGKKAARELLPVKVMKPAEGKGGVAVFFFARKENPITAADAEATFVTKLGKYDITRTFDLADMKVGDDLDL